MFQNFDTFALRPLAQQDAPELARRLNNPKILRNLQNPPDPFTLADAEEWLETRIQSEGAHQIAAIEINGALAGVIGYRIGEKTECRQATIGYWLSEDCWGRGIMTHAVAHVTGHILALPEILRVGGEVFAWNPASARVLEKCGYSFEARLRQAVWKHNEVTDLLIYARLKELA